MRKNPVETNPFVSALEIKSMWNMKSESQDVEYGASQIRRYECKIVDIDERTTIFTEHLFEWFLDLSSSSKDMFMFIASRIRFGEDVIEINEEKYMEELKISKKTFYTAKLALTNRLIIPRISRKNTYWVNPSYIFKGNRVVHYPNSLKITNECPIKLSK